MSKPIAIVAGEPNSISSEIIFKSWAQRKKYIHKPIFIIGSARILILQNKKLKYNIKIKIIKENFKIKDLKSSELPVFDITFFQKKPFDNLSSKSNPYIIKCFDQALKFTEDGRINGFINCPVAKEYLFKDKYQGVTEFLAKQSKKNVNEVMLIYNKKLSVSPITTHIPLDIVSKRLKYKNIVAKDKAINSFYKKHLKKNTKFAILGFNPHNFSNSKNSIEKNVIRKAIKALKALNINVHGPISPDSSFMNIDKTKYDVIVGMYHDQVLTPFKALYNYNAINITLGLSYIRISPDHGIAQDITGKGIANPKSLIESIKFFNHIK